MRQRIAIYPFDHEFLPLVRNNVQEKIWEFTHAVSPAGWGFSGKDAGALDQGVELGLIISDDFESALSGVDTVLIAQSVNSINKEKEIIPKIKLAIKHKKNVICTVELTSEEYILFKTMCAEKGCSFYYHHNHINKEKLKDFLLNKPPLQDISSSIAMVFSITNNMGNLETQLGLRKFFEGQGYKVSLISSKSYASAFNAHPAPDFLFCNDFTESEKVILFNQYVKDVDRSERPDVIIIGVPGGLLPLKKLDTDNFGILPFILTRGAQPDVSIVCTYADGYSKRYFEELTPRLDYRYSMGLAGYLVNNRTLDFTTASPTDMPRLIHLNDELTCERIPTEVRDVLHVRSEQEVLFNNLLAKLHTYGEVEAF